MKAPPAIVVTSLAQHRNRARLERLLHYLNNRCSLVLIGHAPGQEDAKLTRLMEQRRQSLVEWTCEHLGSATVVVEPTSFL